MRRDTRTLVEKRVGLVAMDLALDRVERRSHRLTVVRALELEHRRVNRRRCVPDEVESTGRGEKVGDRQPASDVPAAEVAVVIASRHAVDKRLLLEGPDTRLDPDASQLLLDLHEYVRAQAIP